MTERPPELLGVIVSPSLHPPANTTLESDFSALRRLANYLQVPEPESPVIAILRQQHEELPPVLSIQVELGLGGTIETAHHAYFPQLADPHYTKIDVVTPQMDERLITEGLARSLLGYKVRPPAKSILAFGGGAVLIAEGLIHTTNELLSSEPATAGPILLALGGASIWGVTERYKGRLLPNLDDIAPPIRIVPEASPPGQ